jgi:cation:H+ antiporter
MLIDIAAILTGFILLVWGADRFVVGAAALANNLGVSPLIIGLTVVGLGTSAPEILVAAIAAWSGNPSLGLGNALGSNITNVGLVVGATALLMPIAVHSQTLKREFPLLLGLMAAALLLLIDLELSFIDGVILIAAMVLVILWLIYQARHTPVNDPLESEYADEIPTQTTTRRALIWLFIGMIVLLGSSKLLVWGAVNIATAFGISDLVIGLTIIAIGTSLPELAASIMSTLKNEPDIAIGNILGSNMFNLLAVMGVPSLIIPFSFGPEVLSRDYLIMVLFTVALFVMAFGIRGKGRINRIEGGVLLLAYFGYMLLLYNSVIH